MAPPKAVARSLRKSATRLSSIKREVVAEAGEYAIEQASSRGGRMFQSRYPLFAEVVEKRESKKRTTILVYPKPAGGWSIKSFGRRAVRGQSSRRKLLNISGVGPRPEAAATVGDGEWTRVQDDVEVEYGELMESKIEEALGDG